MKPPKAFLGKPHQATDAVVEEAKKLELTRAKCLVNYQASALGLCPHAIAHVFRICLAFREGAEVVYIHDVSRLLVQMHGIASVMQPSTWKLAAIHNELMSLLSCIHCPTEAHRQSRQAKYVTSSKESPRDRRNSAGISLPRIGINPKKELRSSSILNV